jgi:prophage antirepressor-like protein
MNNLQIFNNSEFGELGVIMIDDKPYFPATKCAKILGYTNPQKAIRDHCKGVNESFTPSAGGAQKQKFIPEGDLYRLIARSKLPSAVRFEAWVFDNVLPSIRQHGAYMTPETLARALLTPEGMIQVLTALHNEQVKNAALSNTVAQMKPKAAFADAVTESDDAVSFGEMAKILRQNGLPYGRTRLCEALRRDGFLVRQDCVDFNTPTQHAMERGLFYHAKHMNALPAGVPATKNAIRVTGKGQQVLLQHFQRKHQAGEAFVQ